MFNPSQLPAPSFPPTDFILIKKVELQNWLQETQKENETQTQHIN
jgi:hypothetical protein